MARAFQVHSADNVATLLEDVAADSAVEIVNGPVLQLKSNAAIVLGHKISLREIPAGERVTKFGVPIGRATVLIRAGDWVHLHNVASEVDQRSATLDVQTGAVTDTQYV